MASPDSPAHYVPAAMVRYLSATDTRGSRWVAVIDRGGGFKVRVTVPYEQGPDLAVTAAVDRWNQRYGSGCDWRILGPALTLDGGNRYAYPVGL